MKRTPMPPRKSRLKAGKGHTRSSALARATRLERQTRLKPRSRKGSRFPHRRCPTYTAWIRSLPCILAGPHHRCTSPVECCHVRTRNAGGDDIGNCFPACRAVHEEQHRGILTFQRKYGLDLPAIAGALGRAYDEERGT